MDSAYVYAHALPMPMPMPVYGYANISAFASVCACAMPLCNHRVCHPGDMSEELNTHCDVSNMIVFAGPCVTAKLTSQLRSRQMPSQDFTALLAELDAAAPGEEGGAARARGVLKALKGSYVTSQQVRPGRSCS